MIKNWKIYNNYIKGKKDNEDIGLLNNRIE